MLIRTAPPLNTPRNPEATVLYRVVAEQLETFLRRQSELSGTDAAEFLAVAAFIWLPAFSRNFLQRPVQNPYTFLIGTSPVINPTADEVRRRIEEPKHRFRPTFLFRLLY